MAGVPWGFDGVYGTDIRPPHKNSAKAWAQDETNPGLNDGTRLTASIINRLVGNIRSLAQAAEITLSEDGDDDIKNAIVALVGLIPPSLHTHDDRYYTQSQISELIADAIAGLQSLAAKGLANGYASLDSSGKVPTAQLPDAVLGALSFQTAWNATTNTPALTSSAGTKGHYYIVDTDGATTLNGITDWKVGDWAVFDGVVWRKIDNTDAIASVAGLTGNISASSLKAALALLVGDVSGAAPLASPVFTGNPQAPTQLPGDNSQKLATTAYVDASLASTPDATESVKGKAELATAAEAAAGTDTSRIVTPAGAKAAIGAWGHAADVVLEDQKSSGTDGGTATSGSWETRTLNTSVRNVGSLASLSSNQFTLPAGTFEIEWSAPSVQAGPHQSRLYNVTDASVVAYGSSEYSASTTSYASSRSLGKAVVTIAGSKAFRLEHRVTTTRATYGYGAQAAMGGSEIFSRVSIKRVAG